MNEEQMIEELQAKGYLVRKRAMTDEERKAINDARIEYRNHALRLEIKSLENELINGDYATVHDLQRSRIDRRRFALQRVLDGALQREAANDVGATAPVVSRWVREAIDKAYGPNEDGSGTGDQD